MYRSRLLAVVLMLLAANSASAAPRYFVLRQPPRPLHAPAKNVYEEAPVYRAPYAWGWFGAHGHSPGTYHRDYYNDTWRFGVQW